MTRGVDSNNVEWVSGALPLQQVGESPAHISVPDQCYSQNAILATLRMSANKLSAHTFFVSQICYRYRPGHH